jgi:hypothetical protein
MRERIELDSKRLVSDPYTCLLTGQFLISPVGWLPRGRPLSAMAVSFVSLTKAGPESDSEGLGEDALLFSAN